MATHRKICFSFPSVLTQDLGGEKVDEEISLEDTLATDMSIIAPVSVCFFIRVRHRGVCHLHRQLPQTLDHFRVSELPTLSL